MTRSALLALTLAVAGCAGDATSAKEGPPYGDGGPTGDALPVDRLALLVETQGTLHPGDRVVVSAETGLLVETYSWTVTGPAGPVQAAVVDPQTGWRKVAFDVGNAGSYTITCIAKLGWQKGTEQASASVQVEPPNAKKRVYSVRIIPPLTSELPPTDQLVEVGGEDQAGLTWQVSPGITKSFAATANGKRIEAYLRLLSGAEDRYPRDIFLGKDPSTGTPAKVSGIFHALVLPLDTAIAPNLYASLDPAVLPQAWVAKLEARTQIGGTVERGKQLLAGAKVTLHRTSSAGIVVPSSVSVTGPDGAFQVEAQSLPGQATLTVVPPQGKGLPIAVVEGLGAPTIKQGWKVVYKETLPVAVSGTVVRTDGKPASGATVVLAMDGGEVGSLTIGAATTPIPVKGRFLTTLVSDKAGTLRDPETQSEVHLLPPGTYKAELWPGKSETIEQGYRQTSVVVAAGAAAFKVELAPRAMLSGKVLDRDSKPVLATVTVTSATSSFTASTSLGKGEYSMHVDDNTSYTLTARPLDAARLGTFYQPKLLVAKAATADVLLPTAVLVTGMLRTTGNSLVKDALMRARCVSASCANQGIVDEAKTRTDGTFVLRIPTVAP